MTREEAYKTLKENLCAMCAYGSQNMESCDIRSCDNRDAIKALEQEPCEDAISRKSIKQKLQEHHDFFVNAYGGFSNLPQNDKSRVDEITNCIAMVVNEPSITPQEPKFIAKSDGTIEQIKNCNGCVFRKEWEKIGKLLSVVLEKQTEQEPKTGHWIEEFNDLEGEVRFTCSSCGKFQLFGTDFCPNCGADMREVVEK